MPSFSHNFSFAVCTFERCKLHRTFHGECEPSSSVCIVSDCGLDFARDRRLISGRGERIFPLAFVSRPVLGPTQPHVQWVPRVLNPGVKRGRGVTLTTHTHLVPRSRMSGSYTSSPPKRLHGVWWNRFSFNLHVKYVEENMKFSTMQVHLNVNRILSGRNFM
jgi:hypothetical protein